MATLRVFKSNGERVDPDDGAQDRSAAVGIDGDTARTLLRKGLYLYHDRAAGRLLWYFKARDGVEYQYLAEYVDAEQDAEALPASARRALTDLSRREGWELRTAEEGVEAIHAGLADADARAPQADVTALDEAAPVTSPIVLGTDGVPDALGVYRHLRHDGYERILIAHGGVDERYPPADVVVVPHTTTERGVPIRRTELEVAERSLSRNLDAAFDRLRGRAEATARAERIAAALDPPRTVEIRPETAGASSDRGRPAAAFVGGGVVAAGSAGASVLLGGPSGVAPLVIGLVAAAVGGGVLARVASRERPGDGDVSLPDDVRESLSEAERAIGRIVDNASVDDAAAYLETHVLSDRPLTAETAATGSGSRLTTAVAYALGAASGLGLARLVVL